MERTIGSAGEAGFALLVPVIKPATWNRYRRDWDTQCWPLATKGFFAFRQHIPKLVAGLV